MTYDGPPPYPPVRLGQSKLQTRTIIYLLLEKLQQEQAQVRRHTTSVHLVLYVMHMTTGRKDDPWLPVGMKKKVSSNYGKKENSGHTSGFSQGRRTSPSHMCRNASRCPPSMSQPSQYAHTPPLSSQGCPGAPHDQHTSSSSRSTEETLREMYHKQLGSSVCCPVQNKHESKFVKISNLKSQIPNLKSQIPNLKSQISNLKSQIANLKSQL